MALEQGQTYIEIRAKLDALKRDLAESERLSKESGEKVARTTGEKMSATGKTLTRTLTPAAAAFGAFALKAFNEVDGGLDAIRAGTGATGEELEKLGESMKRVGGSVTQDLSEVGAVMADLNTRTGLVGTELERLTKAFLDLNGRLNNQASVESVTRAFGDWAVATEDQADTLDLLFRASQATGPSIDTLSDKLVRFGAPLRQMGFDLETSTVLLGKFEQEGVNTNLVMGSMRIALGKLAREGVKDIPGEFQRLVKGIEDAGSAGEANTMALDIFGARAGPDMAAAIREGRFDLGKLYRQIKDGQETIESAAEDTKDWSDKLKMLFNRAQAVVGPVGEISFALAGVAMAAGPTLQVLGKITTAYKLQKDAAVATGTASVLQMGRLRLAAGEAAAGIGKIGTALKLIPILGAAYGITEVTKRLVELEDQADKTSSPIDNIITRLDDFSGQTGPMQLGWKNLQWTMRKFGIGVEEAGIGAEGGFSRIQKAAKETTKDVKTFAGMTKNELTDWRDSAKDSLIDISGAFGKLSDDANVTADELIEAYRKQIEAVGDFRKNIRTLIERGAKPEFIKSLIDMGDQGALWAEGLANSNKKTTDAFFKTRKQAGSELKSLTGLVKEAAQDTGRETGRMAGDFRKVGDSVQGATSKAKDFATIIGDLAKIPGMRFKLDIDTPQGDGFGVAAGVGGTAVSWAQAAINAVPGPQVITSTYRPGAITSSGNPSYHGDASNPAADISGPQDASGTFIYGDAIYNFLKRFPYRELLWRTADHYDHVHVADMGAIVKGPALIAQGNITEAHIPLTGPGAKGLRISGTLDIPGIGKAILRGATVAINAHANKEDDITRTRQPLFD